MLYGEKTFLHIGMKVELFCDKSLILHIFGRRTQLSTRIRQVFYQLKRIPNNNQAKWTQAAVQQSITTTIILSNKLEQVAADAADSTVARCTVIRGEHHTAKLTFTPAQQCNIHYRKKLLTFVWESCTHITKRSPGWSKWAPVHLISYNPPSLEYHYFKLSIIVHNAFQHREHLLVLVISFPENYNYIGLTPKAWKLNPLDEQTCRDKARVRHLPAPKLVLMLLSCL